MRGKYAVEIKTNKKKDLISLSTNLQLEKLRGNKRQIMTHRVEERRKRKPKVLLAKKTNMLCS